MKLIFLSAIFFNVLTKAGITETLKGLNPKNCEISKEIKYLKKKIEGKKIIIRHIKKCKDKESHLYVENHLVRTMNQVLMIEVFEEKLKNLKVLRFLEPKEYQAPLSWIKKLFGKSLQEMRMGKNIDALTGATLTSHSTVDNVAKVLKIHKELEKIE